jgi:hypothetical protein
MGKYEAIQDKKIQTSFALEGRFLGYAANDRGKLKLIRLASTSEHHIKISAHQPWRMDSGHGHSSS